MTVSTPTTAGQILTSAYVNNNINSGLVYITSATVGTAVASATVSNCFSADYDNYKIVLSGGSASASTGIAVGLNSGPATGFYYGLVYATYASSAVTANVNTNNGGNWGYVGGSTAGANATLNFDLHAPFLSTYTSIHNGSYSGTATSGTGNGVLLATTSFTGFVFAPATGTLTGGTVTVYGYRKA